MPPERRKVPFSGKAKKNQVKVKVEKKTATIDSERDRWSSEDERTGHTRVIYIFPHVKFVEVVNEMKQESREIIVRQPDVIFEAPSAEYYPDGLTFPKRPPWNYSMSKEEVKMALKKWYKECKHLWSDESNRRYYETNGETWKELWRVIEMLDIALIAVDIRYPTAMFPPHLFHYISVELKKQVILVLNKIDLVPAPVVVAWKHYFLEKYPGLRVITFTSFPKYNLRNPSTKAGINVKRKTKGKRRLLAEGAKKVYEVCKEIVGNEIDISSWHAKIMDEINIENEDEDIEIGETVQLKSQDTHHQDYKRFHDGILTIGCIGLPNVGKSSLINALMGKRVVKVSRTRDRTKHFQTIFLTPHVRLCDCPGLVFPTTIPRALQTIIGSFPTSQVRVPCWTVKYIAERVDLVSLLKLEHPEHSDSWSAVDICDAWAAKKGFFTERSARLDTNRAANHLLRLTLDGKIVLYFAPPGFSANKGSWEQHSEVQEVKWVQALNSSDSDPSGHLSETEHSSEDNYSVASSASGIPRDPSDADEDSDTPVDTKNKLTFLGSPSLSD